MSQETDTLINRYRPAKFNDVIGQDAAVRSLEKVIKGKISKAFVFAGDAGVGKTTLAMIVAAQFGVQPHDIHDTDAATHSGIDDMRAIQDALQYNTATGTPRALILDECHQLSKQAWDSLLKSVETSRNTIWFFCTTNIAKVPKAIITRSTVYKLKPIARAELFDLLDMIAREEKYDIPDEVIDECIRAANGSAREAISNLAVTSHCTNAAEAAELIEGTSGLTTPAMIDLCRLLASKDRADWKTTIAMLNGIEGQSPEGIRIQVANYIAAVLKGCKHDDEAWRHVKTLEIWTTPIAGNDATAQLLVMIGKTVL